MLPARSVRPRRRALLIFTLMLLSAGASAPRLHAQVIVYEDYVPPRQNLYTRERFLSFYLHSAGFALGYEQGRLNRKFRYEGWSVEFSTQLNPKAIRVSWTGAGRRYVYGQMNSFCMLRGGYGGRYTFNEKPHWGGVALSLIYNGGLSLGLAFPQNHYIVYGSELNMSLIHNSEPTRPY